MSNINISVLNIGYVRTNCYIISNKETKEAIIIDPADDADTIIEAVAKDKLNVKAILLTHGHFDHILAARATADYYQVQIYASEYEKDLLSDSYKNCSSNVVVGMYCTLIPDVLLKDEEVISIGGMNIKVLHTPGHTKGSVCYYFAEDKVLISGDTLFKDSIGRTDLPTGNNNMLITSIHEKLMDLSDDVIVYPGHGSSTTIGYERVNNKFF